MADVTPGRGSTQYLNDDKPGSFCYIGNNVYFITSSGQSLWTYNEQTNQSNSIYSGSKIHGLSISNNKVLFEDFNNSLWVTNGTSQGTSQLTNGSTLNKPYFAPSIISYNNVVYFQSSDNKMWRSDGTNSGTYLFKNINPQFFNGYASVDSLSVLLNNTLYFVADDGVSGFELWKTDGTLQGTVIVKDINPGAGNSMISPQTGEVSSFFTKVNNSFYFLANDNIHGLELWKSDGTTGGTLMVKDISTGSASSDILSLTHVDNKLVFFVYDNAKGKYVLWQTDGSEAGTFVVNDNNLNNVTFLANFNLANTITSIGNKIYFNGTTPQFGAELWVGALEGTLPLTLLNFTGELLKTDAQLKWATVNEQNFSRFNLQRSLDGSQFATIATIKAKGTNGLQTDYNYVDNNITTLGANKIYYRLQQADNDGKTSLSKVVIINLNNKPNTITVNPNPVNTSCELFVNSNSNQKIAVRFMNAEGKNIVSESKQIASGLNKLNYNSAQWSGGIYIVQVSFADGSNKKLKIVKK